MLKAVLDATDKTNTICVVVLIHGRPATFGGGPEGSANNPLLEHPKLGALVAAWRPGEQGGHGIVDLLVGRAPFTGKLAHAWPRTAALVNSAAHPWYATLIDI